MVERPGERRHGRLTRRLQGYGNGVMPEYWYEHIQNRILRAREAQMRAVECGVGTPDYNHLMQIANATVDQGIKVLQDADVRGITIGPGIDGYPTLLPEPSDKPHVTRKIVIIPVVDTSFLRNIRKPRVRLKVIEFTLFKE